MSNESDDDITWVKPSLLCRFLSLDIISKLYWKLPFGESIEVAWPKSNPQTNDPNEQWRPWLEENVGQQHLDWAWRISRHRSLYVQIKFRKKIYASQFILMFGAE